MGNQRELFDDKRYEFYEPLPEDYPRGTFTPLHPKFTRRAKVRTVGKHPREFSVDLAIHECDCEKGHGFGWAAQSSKWYTNPYCSHKLRLIASTVEAETDSSEKEEMLRAYLRALGTRYNPFECVSAFHKELRRGDFEQAWFFGMVLSTKRSLRGVIQYLLNILYEETRDHELGNFLLDLLGDPRLITLSNVAKAIQWFCLAKKKWELPHRLVIFESEMRGYKKLADKYSPDVAKGRNIIPADQELALTAMLKKGLKTRDLDMMQAGLKGLQKLQFEPVTVMGKGSEGGLADYRYKLYEKLYDIAEATLPDEHAAWAVITFVNRRITAGRGIGYHELNAIADAIAGEPYESGLLSPATVKAVRLRPTPAIELGKWPPIPLYAQDNHTYAGKHLMRRFPEQLLPGRKQTELDFRYCGAYFGVAYRMISYHQHGKVEAWENVKWPTDLYKIVTMLWY